MKRIAKFIINKAFGPDPTDSGFERIMGGVRRGDRRELLIGFALAGMSYMKRTKPTKELIYRKSVPEGSAVVVHHKKRGNPHIEVIKPSDS